MNARAENRDCNQRPSFTLQLVRPSAELNYFGQRRPATRMIRDSVRAKKKYTREKNIKKYENKIEGKQNKNLQQIETIYSK